MSWHPPFNFQRDLERTSWRSFSSFLVVLLLPACVLLTSRGFAADPASKLLSEPGLYDYAGDLGEKTVIGLTLHRRDGEKVTGSYFYKKYLKDIPLNGEFTAERDLVLREDDAKGQLAGAFTLHFADKDPRHKRGDDQPLTIDVLTGTWASADKSKTLPVYLSLTQIVAGGSGNRRYQVAGAANDAVVEEGAQKFCAAVEKGNRKAVAENLSYPVAFSVGGKRSKAANAEEFISHYDEIFTPKFVARIKDAVPHHLFANAQGIMLADGAVWLNPQGKVFAINN